MNVIARPFLRWSAAVAGAALLAGSCAQETPGLPPPGIAGNSTPRLFFPLAIGLDPTGQRLYVANANLDRAFNAGTLVELPTSLFDEAAAVPGTKTLAGLPQGTPTGRLDSFASELQVSPDGSTVFVTTRESDLLNAAPIGADGHLACVDKDCSKDAVQLAQQKMFDPFGLRVVSVQLPGQPAPEPVAIVGHQAPPTTGDEDANRAWVALIPQSLARQSAQPFSHGAVRVEIGPVGSIALAVDPATARTFIGGCFRRVRGESVIACSFVTDEPVSRENPLRSFLPAAALQPSSGGTTVQTTNLASFLGGGDTQDVALSGDGRILYVATTRPNALLVLDTPAPGEAVPNLRRVIPLASAPTKLQVLPRPTGDIVVASSSRTNSLLVVDPAAGSVLNQLQVGTGPFALAAQKTAGGDRVYVALFNACAVAAVDVPNDRPFDAAVVGTVGQCP